MEKTVGQHPVQDAHDPVKTLVVAVSGVPGSGRTTMRKALEIRFGVRTCDGHRPASAGIEAGTHLPPDIEIRVIGAQARRADAAAVASARIPTVIVAGKADTRPDAVGLAQRAGRELGLPVFPVSALLASAHVEDVGLTWLRRWSRAGESVPTAAAAFAEIGDAAEQRARARLLADLGRSGLVTALELIGSHPEIGAAAVTARLREAGGIDALVAPIVAAGPVIAAHRRARRLAGLRLLAARGFDRLASERRLVQESAR